MKKRFYLVPVAALTAVTAFAQPEPDPAWIVSSDLTLDFVGMLSRLGAGNILVTSGSTLTFGEEALNICGLPTADGQVIILDNGAKVRFFDSPETPYPDPDAPENMLYQQYLLEGENAKTASTYNFYVQGEGNEIFLDSYMTLGGSITGDGDVTIYATDKTTLDFVGIHFLSDQTLQFTGTVFLKTLDGYSCDTIRYGQTYPGQSLLSDAATTIAGSNYSTVQFTTDITGLNEPVLYYTGNASKHNAWGRIVGKGTVYSDAGGFRFWKPNQNTTYEVNFTGINGAGRNVEFYPGGDLVFEGYVDVPGVDAYNRGGSSFFFNSKTPSFSQITGSFSYRAVSILGGSGVIDAGLNANYVRAGAYNPGYPYHSVGDLTVKAVYFSNNPAQVNQNIVELDFDGKNIDVLNVTEVFNFCSTRNNFRICLLPSVFEQAPKEGNYKVINGPIQTTDKPVQDTIGFWVYESAGDKFAVWNDETEDFTDSISSFSAASVLELFPDINQTVATFTNFYGDEVAVYNGYDPITPNSNKRYRYNLTYWGPGTGFGRDNYVSQSPQGDERQALLDEGREAFLALDGKFVPGTNEKAKFVTPTIQTTNGDNPTEQIYPYTFDYDYERAFNFLVTVTAPEVNGKVALQPTGDTLTFNTGTINYNQDAEAFVSNTIPYVAAAGDTVNYWFDFSQIMQKGIVQLLSDKVPAVDPNDEPLNDVTDAIATLKKELRLVEERAIFTLDGKRVNTYVPGFNVVTTRYTDGSIETHKVFMAE